jgi:hypothetical protein
MKKKAIGKSDYRKSGTVLKTTDNRKGYHAGGSTAQNQMVKATEDTRSQRINAQNQMAKDMQGPDAPVFEKPSGSISGMRPQPRPRVGPGRVRRRPTRKPISRPRRTLRGSLGRPTRSVRRSSPMRPRSAPSLRRRSVGSTLRSRRPSFRSLRRR